MFDLLLFGVFPYVAVALGVAVGLWRYFKDQFTYSSLSSQFLEERQLFWGSVPWHYGIVILLTGHLIGIVLPSEVKAFNGVPIRLYILEATAFALGLLALVGLVLLSIRRSASSRIRVVTTPMDIAVLALLLIQVGAGVGIALFYRWGSAWFVQTMTPWLWSLVGLTPNVDLIAPMPWLVKLHAFNGFLLVAVLPFSRLVHLVVPPLSYLWQPYQKVIWSQRPPQHQ